MIKNQKQFKKTIERYSKMIYLVEEELKNTGRVYQLKPYIRGLSSVIPGSFCDLYSGLDCSYKNKAGNKIFCPLDEKGCCNGLWVKMVKSLTWEDWLQNAKELREYIKKKEREENEKS